jgi:hypothetical protein
MGEHHLQDSGIHNVEHRAASLFIIGLRSLVLGSFANLFYRSYFLLTITPWMDSFGSSAPREVKHSIFWIIYNSDPFQQGMEKSELPEARFTNIEWKNEMVAIDPMVLPKRWLQRCKCCSYET